VSEPESLESSTEPEDQKCLKSNRKPSQSVSCKQPGCDKSFGKKTDMDRHFESIHEGAGFLCGDCENEGKQSPLKRKDHFFTHLHRHHGWEEKTCKKCPWPTCQPSNQKQSRLFSTQSSLERHLLMRHIGKIPESSQQREAGSSSLPDAQGKWSLHFYSHAFQVFYSFFLPFVEVGVADQEYSLTSIKRKLDHEQQGAKRPRCGDTAIDVQPIFDLRGQIKAPFIVASNSFHNKENAENFGTGHPAHALSGCQGFESELSESAGDDERFLLDVSPVDYLALLELSGYSEFCGY
jgi:hypothetical protein